jgi:hypothetical protein
MSVYFANPQPGGKNSIIDRATFLTRQVWWVDSANGTDAVGYGGSPDAPLATLAYLITNATAMGLAANAAIVLMPGHNEGIANAQIDIDVAGLQIIGHPAAVGSLKPIIDFDHANAEITVSANNVKLAGFNVRPSITAVLIGIEVDTDVTGTVFEDVECMIGEDGAGADEFVKAIRLVSGNDDTVFRNVKILAHASAAQATHGIHIDAASDRLVFDNVVIDGPYATAGILEDAAGLNHVVKGCSLDVTGANYSFHSTSTFAQRTGNRAAGLSDDDGTIFVVTKTVAANTAVAAGADITGVSAGGILIEDVSVMVGATTVDSAGHAAVLEVYSNNAIGPGSFYTAAQAKLVATYVVSGQFATSFSRCVLESGKKLLYKATTEDVTSAGNLTFKIVCRRLAAGASLAAA